MARDDVSKLYFDLVKERMDRGIKQADAIKEVAEQTQKNEGTVRAGLYNYKRRHSIDGKAATARDFDSYMDQVKALLVEARATLDEDVDKAKKALDEARSKYETVTKRRDEKLAEIDEKLKALS